MNMIMKELLPSSETEKMDHSPQINIQLQTNSSASLLHLLNMIYQIEKVFPVDEFFFFSGNFSSHGQASRYTQWEENYGHRLNFNYIHAFFSFSKQHLSWYRVPNSCPLLSTSYVNHQTSSDLSP